MGPPTDISARGVGGDQSEQWRSNRRLSVFVYIVIGAILILKLFNVFNGTLNWDTNYYLNIGTNYIDHGALTPLMWRLDPHWNIISGAGSGYGVLLLTIWLKLFGLSVNSGQVLMYLVGLVTLPVFYLRTAKNLVE